ncbi:MAG TPA: IS21 family transposase [Candidatus Angelobacter sp.]|nr:IS21 family transposase [Candidatus Angelobacter sp.]
MISYETFCKIRQLADQKHLNPAQIAAELDLDLKTAEKWVQCSTYQQRRACKRPSKLDPFKGRIVAMLEAHAYTAQQIFQQIKTEGYSGGYSILKALVQLVRPVRKPAYLTLEFAPGQCAQVDWGSFGWANVGTTRRRLSFFVMVLCYSRLLYVEFTLGQGMEWFLSCHQHALEFFGGTPQKIMIDNLKTGVLHHPVGGHAQFHPRYLDFAAHYGFVPVACAVRKPNEKGRVENGVGYVKGNLLRGLEIPSFAAINPAAAQWLRTVANVRIHGETRRKPLEMFQEEKAQLKPLPALSYDPAAIQAVTASSRCRVSFETNRYSIPHLYAGQKLTLKIYPDRLSLFHNEKLIATHSRSFERHQDVRNPDHVKELENQRIRARQQTLLLAFLNLTPQAQLYYRKLEEKSLNAPHHVQKIVALSEIYGPEQVARAIADAIAFDAYGCEYIANILEQRQRLPVTPSALHLTRRQDLLDLELPPADLSPYKNPSPS